MHNPRYSFNGIAEENHLSMLSEEQLRQVLDATGCAWVSAKQHVGYDDHSRSC